MVAQYDPRRRCFSSAAGFRGRYPWLICSSLPRLADSMSCRRLIPSTITRARWRVVFVDSANGFKCSCYDNVCLIAPILSRALTCRNPRRYDKSNSFVSRMVSKWRFAFTTR
jgi:hypothetical protein